MENINSHSTISKVFITLIIVIVMQACVQESAPITVGYIIDNGGTHANDTVKGIQLAIDLHNAQERQDGSPKLKLTVRDAGPDARDSINVARALIVQNDIKFLLGPNTSRAALPISKLAQTTKTIMISNGSTHPDTTKDKPYVYRVINTDDQQVEALVDFLIKQRDYPEIAILSDAANVYSRHMAKIFREKFTNQGGKIIFDEEYITGETNFKSTLSAIFQQENAVVFLPNFSKDLKHQLTSLNQENKALVLVGTDSLSLTDFSDLPMISEVIASLATDPIRFSDNHKSKQFVKEYKEKYHIYPNMSSAVSFDMTNLLINAIRSNLNLDVEQIRIYLANVNYSGVTGEISFTPQGNLKRKANIFIFNPASGVE